MGLRRRHLESIPGGKLDQGQTDNAGPGNTMPGKGDLVSDAYAPYLNHVKHRRAWRSGLHAAPPGLPGSPQSPSHTAGAEAETGFPTREQVGSKQFGRIALAWYRRHVLGESEELPDGVTSFVDYEASKIEEVARQEGSYESEPPHDDVEPPKPPAA